MLQIYFENKAEMICDEVIAGESSQFLGLCMRKEGGAILLSRELEREARLAGLGSSEARVCLQSTKLE